MNARALVLWLAAVLSVVGPQVGRALEIGDPAPPFELKASDGKTYRLTDYAGKQAVVIAWYPRAFTSGCTVECRSLAQNGDLLRAFDVAYFMASVDPADDNARFAAEAGADFPLLSDPDKTTAKAYDVLGMMGVANRHTIYIDQSGRVVAIDRDVRPATSAEDMAARLEALGVPRR